MLAQLIVLATVFCNLVLCFINTHVVAVTANTVIGCEMVLLAAALGTIATRSKALYLVLLLLAIYFTVVMTIRGQFDAKIVRDLLIPIVFFFLGRQFEQERGANRMVTFLTCAALAGSLFEWLAVDTYLRFFDVIHYYVARGTVTGDDFGTSRLFINGTRPEDSRNLLPFLGDHRVSGIFLEPLSAANFATVAFAWVLLHDSGRWARLLAKSFALLTIIVLADGRFGLYFCLFMLGLRAAAPLIRSPLLFVSPFLAISALWLYAVLNPQSSADNTIAGRFLSSGDLLASFDAWNLFALSATDGSVMADSGYAYLISQAGIIGVVALWSLFVFAPVHGQRASEFRNILAFYFILLLSVGVSILTIKVEALAWFLFGTLTSSHVTGIRFGQAAVPRLLGAGRRTAWRNWAAEEF